METTSNKSWVLVDFKGKQRSINGIGFKSANEEAKRDPSFVNVLCWDESHGTWVHIAHIEPKWTERL